MLYYVEHSIFNPIFEEKKISIRDFYVKIRFQYKKTTMKDTQLKKSIFYKIFEIFQD